MKRPDVDEERSENGSRHLIFFLIYFMTIGLCFIKSYIYIFFLSHIFLYLYKFVFLGIMYNDLYIVYDGLQVDWQFVSGFPRSCRRGMDGCQDYSIYIYEWRKQSRKDEMYQKLQRAIYHLCKKVKVSKRKCQYKHLVFFFCNGTLL